MLGHRMPIAGMALHTRPPLGVWGFPEAMSFSSSLTRIRSATLRFSLAFPCRCFEIMVGDLRKLLRKHAGRKAEPAAMILDSHALQSAPVSGTRAGYDGDKRRKRSKVHAAMNMLGHLLALHVTAADEPDRAQVGVLAEAVQQITGEHVELAYADQGYTGEIAALAA